MRRSAIGEQGLNRRRVLGCSFAQAQHLLAATLIDPHRRQHHVLAEVHPVDQQRNQGEPAKLAAHQFRQLALGAVHEALAYRALADAADLDRWRQRLQRARVTPGRYSQHHLLQRPLIQRIARAPLPPAR